MPQSQLIRFKHGFQNKSPRPQKSLLCILSILRWKSSSHIILLHIEGQESLTCPSSTVESAREGGSGWYFLGLDTCRTSNMRYFILWSSINYLEMSSEQKKNVFQRDASNSDFIFQINISCEIHVSTGAHRFVCFYTLELIIFDWWRCENMWNFSHFTSQNFCKGQGETFSLAKYETSLRLKNVRDSVHHTRETVPIHHFNPNSLTSHCWFNMEPPPFLSAVLQWNEIQHPPPAYLKLFYFFFSTKPDLRGRHLSCIIHHAATLSTQSTRSHRRLLTFCHAAFKSCPVF